MVPLLAISAFSGTGKTTLLKQLIPLLQDRGVRCGLIKHTHHDMDVDKPGKDSYELRKAGANQVMVASQKRWALMTETPAAEKLDLAFLAGRMDASQLDLILVEGFKEEAVARIVLHREASGHPFPGPLDDFVIAVASDRDQGLALPHLDLNKPDSVADFIAGWLGKQR
ncbi:molybdopterin-guanine dinucleotide biosynthesis protein MobB [Pantoea sp. FN060301]|uniref:molybdopterin-guanine dinucleotide biosynthesis protein MobB n=1 Tax=Pantoea sp. FN060301 TaxID=3420380 RepID=UPI003D178344